MDSFDKRCVSGIKANEAKINELMKRSLMLVTALSPLVGYDNAAKIAKHAHAENLSLKQSALELGLCTEEQFDQYVDPSKMVHPQWGLGWAKNWCTYEVGRCLGLDGGYATSHFFA